MVDFLPDAASTAPMFCTLSDDGVLPTALDVNAEWYDSDFCICDCGHDFVWFVFFFLRCRFWKSWFQNNLYCKPLLMLFILLFNMGFGAS